MRRSRHRTRSSGVLKVFFGAGAKSAKEWRRQFSVSVGIGSANESGWQAGYGSRSSCRRVVRLVQIERCRLVECSTIAMSLNEFSAVHWVPDIAKGGLLGGKPSLAKAIDLLAYKSWVSSSISSWSA